MDRSETILVRDENYKLKASKYCDQRHGAKQLHQLKPGDLVLVKLDNQKGWTEKGIVHGDAEIPRSYNVETKTGVQQRNQHHLKNLPPTVVETDITGNPSSPEGPPDLAPAPPWKNLQNVQVPQFISKNYVALVEVLKGKND